MRRIIGAAAAAVLLVLACAAPAQAARGQGTMLVFDNTTCAGTGNSSSVTLPFSLLFTGFEPGATGTVSAYTQPGGALVGTATLTLDDSGSAAPSSTATSSRACTRSSTTSARAPASRR